MFLYMKQKIEWKKANISTPTQKLTDVFRNEILMNMIKLACASGMKVNRFDIVCYSS